jgi:opine dehydrogenase
MRAAIVGTGGIGRGYAALLAAAGHAPVFWSPSGSALRDFADGARLAATGRIEGEYDVPVASGCAEAVTGADAIIFAVQANGFRRAIDAVAPSIYPGQTVIFSSHSSFAALHMHRRLAARGLTVPVVAWSTTALTARKAGTCGVAISGIRQRLDMATLPVDQASQGLAVSRALFGDRFEPREDVLAIMLSNLNPPAHMANMLGNLTRAEKGEDWPNYGSITPAVGRIVQALDDERIALAAAFGLAVRTVQDHYALSFGVERGPVAEMSAAVYRKRPELLGPKTLDTRFITEDVPYGLVPLEFLGRAAGVELPLHRACIDLFNAVMGHDYRAENDLLQALDLGAHDRAAIRRLLRLGS